MEREDATGRTTDDDVTVRVGLSQLNNFGGRNFRFVCYYRNLAGRIVPCAGNSVITRKRSAK